MTPKCFFIKVAQMREAQRAVRTTSSTTARTRCVRLENEIDEEIRRVLSILDKEQPKQTDLFKE